MTIQPVYFGLVEGAHIDMRGQLHISGVAPDLLVVDQFPSQMRPTFVFAAVEEAGSVDNVAREGTARIAVSSPSDEVAFFQSVPLTSPPKAIPALPARLHVLLPIPFTADKSGVYTLSCDIELGGEELFAGTTVIRVVMPADVGM